MSSKRRGLSTALSVTPEIEQFIRPEQKSIKSDSSESNAIKTTDKETDQTGKKSKTVSSHQNQFSQPLVAITTRFQPTTAETLRRTSLERRLANEFPWSQQEIIEQAVLDWLANQYLP